MIDRYDTTAEDAGDPPESDNMKYVRVVRVKVVPAVEEHPARAAMNRKLERPGALNVRRPVWLVG